MLTRTLSYLDQFARFTRKENVEAVERLLSAHPQLEKFERAQLGEFWVWRGAESTSRLPF
jgi:DNA-directed RNA polymerase II subunit RPB4